MAFAVLFAVAFAVYSIVREGTATPKVATIDNLGFRSMGKPADPATLFAVGNAADEDKQGKKLVNLIKGAKPNRVMYLGGVYEHGSEDDYLLNWRPLLRPLNTKIWPTPGGVEWGRRELGYNKYWTAVSGHQPPPWYVVKAGGWEILSLNSEESGDPGSDQGKWLAERIAKAPSGTCRIAMWNAPHLTGDAEGPSGDVSPLWDALQYHASLVFSARDLSTQRFDRDKSLTQYVVGAGGHGHGAVDGKTPKLAFSNTKSNVAARLDLSPGTARVRLTADTGKVLDDRTYRCDPLKRAK